MRKYSTLVHQMVMVLLLLNIPVEVDAQSKKEKEKSYIVFSDNRKVAGPKIKDDIKTNSTACIILNRNNTIRKEYTPDEVKEYMIDKNTLYKAFDLDFEGIDQRRFLYRVGEADSISIYRLYTDGKDMFFLERDGKIEQLKSKKREDGIRQYQHVLYQAFPENHWKLREITNLKLNNHSLAIFADRVNAEKWKPLNFTTYGMNLSYYGLFSEDESPITFSAFMDHPLSVTNFYIQPTLSWDFKSSEKEAGVLFYFNYSIPLKYVRPFIGVPLTGVSMFTDDDKWHVAPVFNIFLDGWHAGIKVPMNNKTQFYLSQQVWFMDDLLFQTKFGFGMGF